MISYNYVPYQQTLLITRFLQSNRSFDNYHVCVAALALDSKSKDYKVAVYLRKDYNVVLYLSKDFKVVVYLSKDYKVVVYLRLVVRQLVTQQ